MLNQFNLTLAAFHWQTFVVTIVVIGSVVGLYLLMFALRNLHIWLGAKRAGCPVGMATMVAMELRKTNPRQLVPLYLLARKGGVDVSLDAIESHALATGNPARVVKALILAKENGVELPVDTALALDLAGPGTIPADAAHKFNPPFDPAVVECMNAAIEE